MRQRGHDHQDRYRQGGQYTGQEAVLELVCFAMRGLYEMLESLQVEYSIGLAMNARLKKMTDELLEIAVQHFTQTQQNQRLFALFDYQADSWSQPRTVVVKCEANAQGTNRRAIVTNRAGARCCPQGAYDAYADRGESENRNKELKCALQTDRLSDHRYMANVFHDDARPGRQLTGADVDTRGPPADRGSGGFRDAPGRPNSPAKAPLL